MNPISKISPETIKAYQEEISNKSSVATVRRKNVSLKKFFKWATSNEYLPRNPFEKISNSTPKAIAQSKTPILLKTLAISGMTVGMAILTFAIVNKLQLPSTPIASPTPIPAKPAEISESTPIPTTGAPAIGGGPIIKAIDGSDDSIEINPDGIGTVNFIFEGSGQNLLNAQGPNLTGGSLYYGLVANGAIGYDLLRLQSGSNPVTRFSVDSQGNTLIGGGLQVGGVTRLNSMGRLGSITGYYQDSGLFEIDQGVPDYARITKTLSSTTGASSVDVLTLKLDESTLVTGSGSDTLVLKRLGGTTDALALLVDDGNARFDGQLQLGRFTSNPNSIGQGSLVFNTGDNKVSFWNGSAWVLTGSGGDAETLDSLDSTQFLRSDTSDNFTSGTLTLDTGTTLDVKGNIYLTGHNIYNVVSGLETPTIILASNPTGPGVAGDYNTLTYGSWLIQNATNDGMAALMVNQTKGGDIFTASVSGTLKFTIDHDGEVGIGVTAPAYQLQLSTDSAAKPTTNTWTIASDERIKNVVGSFDKGLAEILEVNPIIYTYKVDNALQIVDPGEHVGIIAQAIQTIFPEAITTDKKGYLHFNSDSLSWASINAIKELNSKIEVLSRMIADNIKAGATEVDKFIAKSVQINLISPIPGNDLAIELPQDSRFKIQDSNQNEVAVVDNQGNATFSGELRAKEVHSENLDAIEELLRKVEEDQKLLAEITNIQPESNFENLYVTNQAAINSLSVSQSLSIGVDLIFQSEDSSLNTLSSPLKLQSLAMAPVEIMAGLIKIDTTGSVQIAGNLQVAGKISAPEASFKDLTIENLVVASSQEATISGEVVAGDIETNSTVGKGIIPAGTDQITITNPKVGNYTLIYVTPTSSTQNKVLYIKSKDQGSFTVGFSEALNIDVALNWWIVKTVQ